MALPPLHHFDRMPTKGIRELAPRGSILETSNLETRVCIYEFEQWVYMMQIYKKCCHGIHDIHGTTTTAFFLCQPLLGACVRGPHALGAACVRGRAQNTLYTMSDFTAPGPSGHSKPVRARNPAGVFCTVIPGWKRRIPSDLRS